MADYADNVLLVLREIVRTTTNSRLHAISKHAADELHTAIDDLQRHPTRENLQTINGLWAVGQRIIDVWTAPEPTPPRANAGSAYVKSWEECATRKAA